MKTIRTDRHRGEFDLLLATKLAQAAMMTLEPGGSSDDEPQNEHPGSEQWLYVLSGHGAAIFSSQTSGRKRRVKLESGVLVMIERRERHQIKNTGTTPLRTFNLYVPPAYRSDGEPRPSISKNARKA